MFKVIVAVINFMVDALNRLSTKRYEEARKLDEQVQRLAGQVIKSAEEGRVSAKLASNIAGLLK